MSGFEIIDETAVPAFHRKLLIACCGGPFLDGYVISIIGVALPGIIVSLDLTNNETGLVGAASLIGILFGATVFGALTDRIGREKMYALDLAVLVIACFACSVVTSAWQLIAMRFVLGLAIGADYPIATSLLTEFTPSRRRGYMIGLSSVAWALGAMTAFLVGGLFVWATDGYSEWRWMLASGGILGIIVVLARRGIPESPRWLLRKGRIIEAEQIMSDIYGRSVVLSAPADQRPQNDVSLIKLLSSGYGRRITVCGVLYLAQITPQYAIYTFGPQILNGFGFKGATLEIFGSAAISILFALGCFPALRLVESWGRRPMCVVPFAVMSLPLFGLWLWADGPVWFVILAFCFYAFASGGPSILEWIYPNELFPTHVRASAVGLAVGISRIGAATGTYLLPISLSKLGTDTTMLCGALLTLAGFVTCWLWAPETRGQSLDEASSVN